MLNTIVRHQGRTALCPRTLVLGQTWGQAHGASPRYSERPDLLGAALPACRAPRPSVTSRHAGRARAPQADNTAPRIRSADCRLKGGTAATSVRLFVHDSTYALRRAYNTFSTHDPRRAASDPSSPRRADAAVTRACARRSAARPRVGHARAPPGQTLRRHSGGSPETYTGGLRSGPRRRPVGCRR